MLERLSRGLVFTRRLPSDFGDVRVCVSPEASLCYFKRLTAHNWADILDYARHFIAPRSCVWDIGANVGVFTFAAAAKAGPGGQVVAIEPDLWSVNLLTRSKRLNVGRPLADIAILPAAATDGWSVEELNIPERGRAASHLTASGGAGDDMTGGVRERHHVVGASLDGLADALPPPGVVKIDVDGGELRVLNGMRQIMQRNRPVVLVEVYERNADAVRAYFAQHGYELFDFCDGVRSVARIDRPTYNTLALPADRPLASFLAADPKAMSGAPMIRRAR